MLSFWGKNIKTHFFFGENPSLTEFSNQFIARILTAWCIRLKNTEKVDISEETEFLTNFYKIAFSEKVTTDFENRAKRQAETQTYIMFDMDHKAIPFRASSVHLQPKISILFACFRSECKQLNISVSRYAWKKISPKNFIRSLYWWFKRTENFEIIGLPLSFCLLSCTKKCTCVSPLHTIEIRPRKIPVFPLTRPTMFYVPTLQFLLLSRKKKKKDFHTCEWK